MAYTVHKAVQRIYSELLVHDNDLKMVTTLCQAHFSCLIYTWQINDTIKEMPVLLLPTHRSYMDFIVISVMFFFKQVPVPAIAGA